MTDETGAFVMHDTTAGPHEFQRRRGFRRWICNHCYAPKELHPRTEWVKARPIYNNEYISADAPHFKEGW